MPHTVETPKVSGTSPAEVRTFVPSSRVAADQAKITKKGGPRKMSEAADSLPEKSTVSSPQKDYYKGSAEVGSPLTQSTLYAQRERLTNDAHGIVLALVGLPARGKSFISRKLERFLEWRGFATKVFNVGMFRRDAVVPAEIGRSDFFDAKNQAAAAAREAAASAALEDALKFLSGDGRVAILDATNSTATRRRSIVERVRGSGGSFSVLFVEAICDSEEVLETNLTDKVRNSPDFAGMPLEEALADIRLRVKKYEDVYETVQDCECPYIKVFNLSSKIMASHCYGRLAKSILPYMMAIHIGARPIWLTRAGSGEASDGIEEGQVSTLSAAGEGFARALAEFLRARLDKYWETAAKEREPLQVFGFGSTLCRQCRQRWSLCETFAVAGPSLLKWRLWLLFLSFPLLLQLSPVP
jgi:predicted kinase